MPTAKTVALFALLPSALLAQAPIPQREQTDQIRTPKLMLNQPWQSSQTSGPSPCPSAEKDDAFGAQLILKDRPDTREFQAYLETAAFYTDNVALTRSDKQGDSFLSSTLGLGWHRSFTDRLSASIVGRYGMFRYDRFSALDFQSLNIDATLAYRLPWQVDAFTGYGFTQFTTRMDLREFYSEHAWNLGAQRVFPISRAHSIVAGISAQWTWASPEAAQRDRYSAYLAYHLQATEHLAADFVYRYSFYDYRDAGEGRGDHNHSLALALRYELSEWLALTATVQGAWNRSNQPVFDYDALNLGGSIGVNAKF